MQKEIKNEIDELDKDERAAFVALSEYDLSIDELIELVNISFRDRYASIIRKERENSVCTGEIHNH